MVLRILLVTQWFDPEPTFKGLLFAKALHSQGHEVEVITGFPNYPGGKVYDGYRIRWLQRENIDGVRVNRVPLYPSHDSSPIKRIVNYVSFFLSATLYGIFGAKKPDIVYVYHPPLTACVAGAFISFFRRAPFVCDIQDLWPDTLRVTGMLTSERILKIVSMVCNWVYRRARHIVVLSPGFKRRLIERGVPENKVSVIYNWCDEPALERVGTLDEGLIPDGFNVVFAGNMGHAQALDTVLEAASITARTDPNLNFLLVGAGVQCSYLEQRAMDSGLENVYFIPRMPMDQIGAVLRAADVLLVHLKKDELFEITIPSKTQAYMAVGRPIIMAVDGDAAALVEEAHCGVCCESQNAELLAKQALSLKALPTGQLEKMGENAKSFYNNELSLSRGAGRFSGLFKSLLN